MAMRMERGATVRSEACVRRSIASVGVVILGLYLYSASAAATYFNYRYVRDNGVGEWLLFGEFLPTAQAAVWPYYVYRRVAQAVAPERADVYVDTTPRADSIRRVLLAVAAATELLHSHPSTGPDSLEVARRLEAVISFPASVSMTTLDWVYPGWGNAIRRKLVPGIRGFIALTTLSRDRPAVHRLRTRAAEVLANLKAYVQWNQDNRLPLLQALEGCAIVAQNADSLGNVMQP